MVSQTFALVLALSTVQVVTAQKYGHNSVRVSRDSAVVAANFPTPNITLSGPAFQGNATLLPGFAEGTQPPIDDATIDAYIQKLASRNSFMTYQTANFTSEEGRSFPYVLLSSGGGIGNLTNRSSSSKQKRSNKIKLWVQGGVHGNEPAGDMATLELLAKMDREANWTSKILEKLDILVLPRYNVDGEFYFQRALASNYDPNRDHTKLNRQQTIDIKRLFNEFEPHIALDMHEYTASSRYGRGYQHASDALLAAAKNLNISPAIRELSETLFTEGIGEKLVSAGFRWEPYVTNGTTPAWPLVRFDEAGTDAKIGRNGMGLAQTVTFLFETRGIQLADQEFRRRTACALTMITSTLEIAAANAVTVYETIEKGREDFISSTDPIVITDENTLEETTFQMIWMANGTLVDLPVQFMSAKHAVANLTRPRPTAYIIPRTWSEVVAKLTSLGVTVETLTEPFFGIVESRNITSSTLAPAFYEGTTLNTVTTSAGFQRSIALPAGSFRVPTAQKNAALAFVALEPENIDSFVSFNIIPLERGDEYPVFREV